MKNTTMYPVYRKKKRPVDELVDKTYSLCGKSIVFIMTKKVKTWQGVLYGKLWNQPLGRPEGNQRTA